MRMSHLERIDTESCMKEREKERYCWRAGEISRNEGGEGRDTIRVDGFLAFESIFLVKSDSSERGHVCL